MTRPTPDAIRDALIQAALDAYEEAGVRGLCAEGRWEVAVDAHLLPGRAMGPEPRGKLCGDGPKGLPVGGGGRGGPQACCVERTQGELG